MGSTGNTTTTTTTTTTSGSTTNSSSVSTSSSSAATNTKDIRETVLQLLDKSAYAEAVVGIADSIENENTRKTVRNCIIESGCIEALLAYLFAPCEKVREKVSYILCLLAFEDEGRQHIADYGGIKELFAVAADSTKTVYQREKCLYALSNIANHKSIRPKIIAAGGDDLLMQLIRLDTTKLIVPSCTALSKLIKLDDETCTKVVNSGLLEHLLKLAESSDNDLAVAAIEGMGKLFDFMASPRTHAGKCGIYEGLLRIVQNRNDESPGSKVLRASDTMNLLLVNNLSNRQLALKNGCFHEHIKMLKTNNKELVEKALNFLRNFTENFKDGQEEMMRDPAVVPILLQLLKEGNKITLGALCHMSQNENAKNLMPIHLIEGTLTPLISSPGLTDIERARVAIILANLSDCDKAGSLAIDPKVIKFLAQKTAETLVGDEDRWSLLTFVNGIANLAANITNKELIGAEGIIKSLFDILQVDPKKCTHGRVLTYLDESKATAATALWNLAYFEPNRHRMRALGGLEILKELLATITDERLRKNVKGTLWLLGVRDKLLPTSQKARSFTNSPIISSRELKNLSQQKGVHMMISYCGGNQELAQRVAVALRHKGYNVWLDIYQTGDGTLEEVSAGVAQALGVLVLCNRAYKENPACRLVVEQAQGLGKDVYFLGTERDYTLDGWLKAAADGSHLYDIHSNELFDVSMNKLVHAIELKEKKHLTHFNFGSPQHRSGTSSQQDNANGGGVASWSVRQVSEWLERNGLADYQGLFSSNNVDGVALERIIQLGKQDMAGVSNLLEHFYHVQGVNHQLKLLASFDKLVL